MGIGQLPTSSGVTYTCDTRYFDGGRACAWHNFLCEDYSTTGIAPLSFPTCFDGSQQSPINLDVSEATVGDPGQVTFSGYGDKLTQTPVVRLKSFTLQLDFKQTLTLPAGKVKEEEPQEEDPEEDNGEEGDEEELEPDSPLFPFELDCTDCANCTRSESTRCLSDKCQFCPEDERILIVEQDCFNCVDCPPGSLPPGSLRCLKCQNCPGIDFLDCRTCLEESFALAPGCEQCRTCPPLDTEYERGDYGEYDAEDFSDCRNCFDINFDHPDCGQCKSCPGGPLDTPESRKISRKRKNKKRKNKGRRKDKKEREGKQAEETAEEVQLPTITGGALGANT